eukprot:523450-Rhodomonas_salina.2
MSSCFSSRLSHSHHALQAACAHLSTSSALDALSASRFTNDTRVEFGISAGCLWPSLRVMMCGRFLREFANWTPEVGVIHP